MNAARAALMGSRRRLASASVRRSFVGNGSSARWNFQPIALRGSSMMFSTSSDSEGTAPANDVLSSIDASTMAELANPGVLEGVDPSVDLLGYYPTDLAIRAIDALHLTSGLEWWQSIALFTVLLRVGTFPMTVETMKNGARFQKMKPEMDVIMAKCARRRTHLRKSKCVFEQSTRIFSPSTTSRCGKISPCPSFSSLCLCRAFSASAKCARFILLCRKEAPCGSQT